jgi:intracellular proteinase inhibitor BsuPI
MRAGHVAALAGTIALAYACGSQSHLFSMATASAATSAKGSVEGERATMAGRRGSAPGRLTSSTDVTVTGDDVRFVLHVTNGTAKKLELTFPSGQTHDIIIVDAAGSEVWRWSTGQMFTQALRNQPLDPNASLTYSMRWRRPKVHGPLTAVATLTSTNYPLESRATFALP